MRVVAVAVAVIVGLATSGVADANRKTLKPYANKVVIAIDAPPPTLGELPGYLAANVAKDDHYELIKGPPWPFHLVAVLGKRTKQVTIVIADKAAPAQPLLSVPIAPAHGTLVMAQAEATIAAGFAAGTTYVVHVVAGKKIVARAELRLRE